MNRFTLVLVRQFKTINGCKIRSLSGVGNSDKGPFGS